MVFVVVLSPVVLNTMVGVQGADPQLIEAGRSFAGSESFIFRAITLPAATPVTLVGLRMGMARGIVGIVVAELFAPRRVLATLTFISGQRLDTA